MLNFLYCFVFIASIFLSQSTIAFAAGAGGFRNETPDAGAFGKGSAFVGEANTPAAIYYNPAGLNQIDRLSVSTGGSFITPLVKYKNFSSGDVTQMRQATYLVPHAYVAIPIIKNKFTLGFGAGSYWGLGSEWAEDSFAKYVTTKAEMTNIDTLFTGAYQVNDKWSVAVSADNDDSTVSLNKILPNYGASPDGRIQLKAKDNAWGYRLATMFKVNDKHQFGLMYRSRINHKYEGTVRIDNINTGVYGGNNFTSTSYETKVTEKLTLPQSIVLGYSFKPSKKWTLNFDLEWMDWSSFRRENLTYPDETDAGRSAVLNTGNPVVHDWTSVWSQAIGVEYAATETFRLRAGYYHHSTLASQDNFNPAVPDLASHGLTGGFGYDFNKDFTLDMAYSAILYESRKVDTSLGSGALNGKYSQITHVGMMTFTYKFK